MIANTSAGLLNRRILFALAAMSAVSLGLLSARVAVTRSGGHLSLVWDLFLAWACLPIAVWFGRLVDRGTATWRVAPVGLAWLFVFPNAPYLLTEVIHLSGSLRAGRPLPAWFQSLVGGPLTHRYPPHWLEFLLLLSVGFVGLMLTFTSIEIMRQGLTRRLGGGWADRLCLTALLLAGLGVALGRYERFNSWDVLFRPLTIAHQTLAPLAAGKLRVPAFGLTLGTLLALSQYVLWQSLGRRASQHAD
jgi:uncharacterized membrane protein